MKNLLIPKEKWAVLVLLLFIFIPFASGADSDLKTADYYGRVGDGERARDFMRLEDKQNVWEQTITDSEGAITRKNILQNVLKEINLERTVAGSEVKLMQDAKSKFIDNLKKNGASEMLIENLQSVDKLAKLAGVDLRREKSPLDIKEFIGFDNPALKWQPGEKNIIGDGKVWLNLETLPFGVDKLEYGVVEGKGEFVLKMQQGGNLVLKAGATDENGNFIFTSKLDEKGIKQFVNIGNTGSLSMKDFMMVSGKGDIIADENGFSFSGDLSEITKARLGDFYFSRDKGATGENYVRFNEDRLVMKGIDYTREGFVRTVATQEEFVVLFGKSEQMARSVSFTDYDNKFNKKGNIYFNFDINGNIDGVWKSGYNEDEWVGFNGNVEGELKKIYDSSGDVVKKMIEDVSSWKNINYVDLRDRFYGGDSALKTYANELKMESSYSNYLAIDGNNLYVNGKGKIELFTNANSLVGIDATDFSVKSGKGVVKFNNGEIFFDPTQGPSDYRIDEISMKNNGVNDWNKFYKLDAGGTSFQNRETVNLGRLTKVVSINSNSLGIPGAGFDVPISVDVRAEVPNEKAAEVEELLRKSGAPYTDAVVSALQKAGSSLMVDLNIPDTGAKLGGQETQKLISEKLWPIVVEKLLPKATIDIEGPKEIRPETQKYIDEIGKRIISSIGDAQTISGGRISIGIKDNPNDINAPSILVQLPGEAQPRQIDLASGSGSAVFISKASEASKRAPNVEKGVIPYAYSSGEVFGSRTIKLLSVGFAGRWSVPTESQYSFNSWLSRMLNDNLGIAGTTEYIKSRDRIPSASEEAFFRGNSGFINTYFKDKTKE